MLRALYEVQRHVREGAEHTARVVGLPVRPLPGQTPRATVYREGAARLERIAPDPSVKSAGRTPVLLVPSLINRWYVLDLHPAGSVVATLRDAGLDVWVLDWGVADDSDRHLSWSDLALRISRAMAVVRRTTGAPQCVLLGYSIAGTLSVITAARESHRIAGLVNLAGPVDFARSGMLQRLTDPRWFSPDAVAGAGNIAPAQMLAGFLALRPSNVVSDIVKLADLTLSSRREERDAVLALSGWAYDNVPFPAKAYGEYVSSLFQRNELVAGRHVIDGAAVDLARIECPLLTIVADKDAITPPASALALEHYIGSVDRSVLVVRGGHVSGVVNPSARERFHPQLVDWMTDHVQRADEVA
ncbi:MAG: alpha/beta fold hydrolase [Myxococcales bacterium]|nr:alpha/beta fold hydrolase [Myxococcales bacterium]